MDAPATVGSWTYQGGAAQSLARFGRAGLAPDFTLRCDKVGRSVQLTRAGVVQPPFLMRILTETEKRMLEAQVPASGEAAVTTALGNRDSLLDAMAFSRGRFAVETIGLPTLFLPSWAEVTRVIEDCR